MNSKQTTKKTIDSGWLLIVAFLVLKFANVAGFAAWSAWWVLFPVIPLLAELVKAVLR